MKPRSRIWALVSLLFVGLAVADTARASDQTDLPSGARLRLGRLALRHPDSVEAVLFLPDGKSLLSSGGAASPDGT
jgi:hypothetical protein